jgi:DNA sulfur modification protein DndC
VARTLWDESRQTLGEAIDETAALLNEYGPRYDEWAIAYSGGKDSTVPATLVPHLVATGAVRPPRALTILRADTRMELPPLDAAAELLLARLRAEGYDARTVLPPLDDRFFVYMFGRGVPPPSNTFRWCTDKLKISPMADVVRGLGRDRKTLMLTGVRIGESARRDQTIAAACSRDGAECGQGRLHLAMAGSRDSDINKYFIPGTDSSPCDTLAPILHWRVCHVWNWLLGDNAESVEHPYLELTEQVAEAYGDGGGSKLIESAARTGCVGCNLASRDVALDRLCRRPEWAYLAPLKRLRPLYAALKEPARRLRKPGGEMRKDGELCANQNRMGPLTFEARLWGLREVLSIQHEVCRGAALAGKPAYSLINDVEQARIHDLVAAGTWPDGWSGTEPVANEEYEDWRADGSVLRSMFGLEVER